MILDPKPMSNAERQAKFRRAHPGYDARRKRIARASAIRGAALREKARQAALAAELQAQPTTPSAPMFLPAAPAADPQTAAS
jgi:hypothetical protein